ncbi:MAG: dUTPase [Puniceicoccales bacterium]|nr:dUTPase [Puniceicoccales bacterium]
MLGFLPLPMDYLEHIFELQRKLTERVLPPDALDSEEKRVQWLLNYVGALRQEIAELVDSLPWKWWAHYQKFDLQNARVELVDILHFVISIAQALGMEAADLHRLFCQKNQKNHERQDCGYTQKSSDDSRSIC